MDIGASNWIEDDNSNISAAPDGAPEGMAPSGVNNVLRAHQGAIKRFYNWQSAKATAGTSTAYTLTYGVAPGALLDGMTHLVQFNAINGNAPTLNVNGLGAIPLHYYSAGAWRVVPAALWGTDEVFRVGYYSSGGAYRLLGFRNNTGEITPYAGSTAPPGALLCFGQVVNRTAYAGLFATLGTTYNIGGETGTDFRLPDLRGRVVAGKSDMGGSDAGNLAGGGVLGAALGSQTSSVNVTGNTAGSLSVSVSGQTTAPTSGQGNCVGGGAGEASNWGHVHDLAAAGATSGSLSVFASGAANALQPTRVLNYLIRL